MSSSCNIQQLQQQVSSMLNGNEGLGQSLTDTIISYQEYYELRSKREEDENTIQQLLAQIQALHNECAKFSDENSSLKQYVKEMSMSSLRVNRIHIKLQDNMRQDNKAKDEEIASLLNERQSDILVRELDEIRSVKPSDLKQSLHQTQNNFESKLRQTVDRLLDYERAVEAVFRSQSISISVGSLASSQNQISKTEGRSPEQLMEIMQRFSSIQSANHYERLAYYERLKRENTELISNIDGLRRVINQKNENINQKQQIITELIESSEQDKSRIEQLKKSYKFHFNQSQKEKQKIAEQLKKLKSEKQKLIEKFSQFD